MNNKFILSSLFICLLACDSVPTTASEIISEDINAVVTEEQNDCHDPSLDVCVDPTTNHDYSQDICK